MPALSFIQRGGLFRHSSWDGLFVALAVVHGMALIFAPSVAFVAIGVWWNSNTIAHNFIHLPFFRRRWINKLFSAYLSILLGIPQRLWRDRHLAHHANRRWRFSWSNQLATESLLIALLWTSLAAIAPRFLLSVYLPGYVIGLGLCYLQGLLEHDPEPISHYGRLYNLFFFNDGFHAEHHAHPAEHWTRLPAHSDPPNRISHWPAVLRWIERGGLDGLEHLVLKSKWLQRFVLSAHERAFREFVPVLQNPQRIGIVGGGLFPRTALVLQRIFPSSQITIIDADSRNLATARRFLNCEVEFRHEWFEPRSRCDFDVLVIPLAFRGDKWAVYQRPTAPAVLVHDWIWGKTDRSVVISWPLLKRLNLVLHAAA